MEGISKLSSCEAFKNSAFTATITQLSRPLATTLAIFVAFSVSASSFLVLIQSIIREDSMASCSFLTKVSDLCCFGLW